MGEEPINRAKIKTLLNTHSNQLLQPHFAPFQEYNTKQTLLQDLSPSIPKTKPLKNLRNQAKKQRKTDIITQTTLPVKPNQNKSDLDKLSLCSIKQEEKLDPLNESSTKIFESIKADLNDLKLKTIELSERSSYVVQQLLDQQSINIFNKTSLNALKDFIESPKIFSSDNTNTLQLMINTSIDQATSQLLQKFNNLTNELADIKLKLTSGPFSTNTNQDFDHTKIILEIAKQERERFFEERAVWNSQMLKNQDLISSLIIANQRTVEALKINSVKQAEIDAQVKILNRTEDRTENILKTFLDAQEKASSVFISSFQEMQSEYKKLLEHKSKDLEKDNKDQIDELVKKIDVQMKNNEKKIVSKAQSINAPLKKAIKNLESRLVSDRKRCVKKHPERLLSIEIWAQRARKAIKSYPYWHQLNIQILLKDSNGLLDPENLLWQNYNSCKQAKPFHTLTPSQEWIWHERQDLSDYDLLTHYILDWQLIDSNTTFYISKTFNARFVQILTGGLKFPYRITRITYIGKDFYWWTGLLVFLKSKDCGLREVKCNSDCWGRGVCFVITRPVGHISGRFMDGGYEDVDERIIFERAKKTIELRNCKVADKVRVKDGIRIEEKVESAEVKTVDKIALNDGPGCGFVAKICGYLGESLEFFDFFSIPHQDLDLEFLKPSENEVLDLSYVKMIRLNGYLDYPQADKIYESMDNGLNKDSSACLSRRTVDHGLKKNSPARLLKSSRFLLDCGDIETDKIKESTEISESAENDLNKVNYFLKSRRRPLEHSEKGNEPLHVVEVKDKDELRKRLKNKVKNLKNKRLRMNLRD